MATFHDTILPEIADFIREQPMFFVATAPTEGRINLSPKGMDTFRVLDERTACYLDLTGSGNETAAHIHADGRITVMFNSFDKKPDIVRLYGRGEVVPRETARFSELAAELADIPGARQLIVVHVDSVQSSCGYAVPRMAFVGHRETLAKWAQNKGEKGLRDYRDEKNRKSIDGLPTGLPD